MPRFNKGDRIRCINPGPYEGKGSLTLGRIYEVIKGDSAHVVVYNNTGKRTLAFNSRFVLAELTSKSSLSSILAEYNQKII